MANAPTGFGVFNLQFPDAATIETTLKAKRPPNSCDDKIVQYIAACFSREFYFDGCYALHLERRLQEMPGLFAIPPEEITATVKWMLDALEVSAGCKIPRLPSKDKLKDWLKVEGYTIKPTGLEALSAETITIYTFASDDEKARLEGWLDFFAETPIMTAFAIEHYVNMGQPWLKGDKKKPGRKPDIAVDGIIKRFITKESAKLFVKPAGAEFSIHLAAKEVVGKTLTFHAPANDCIKPGQIEELAALFGGALYRTKDDFTNAWKAKCAGFGIDVSTNPWLTEAFDKIICDINASPSVPKGVIRKPSVGSASDLGGDRKVMESGKGNSLSLDMSALGAAAAVGRHRSPSTGSAASRSGSLSSFSPNSGDLMTPMTPPPRPNRPSMSGNAAAAAAASKPDDAPVVTLVRVLPDGAVPSQHALRKAKLHQRKGMSATMQPLSESTSKPAAQSGGPAGKPAAPNAGGADDDGSSN